MIKTIAKGMKDEKNKNITIYIGLIQYESTSSILLSNPFRRIPLNQLRYKNYKNIYIIQDPKD